MFYLYPLVFPRGHTYAFAAEKAVNRNPFKTNRDHFCFVLPHVRESSTVLDSGFHYVDSTGIPVIFTGSCILDSNLKWDSGFLQLHVFRIPQAQFPGFRSPDCLTCDDLLNMFPCFLAYIRQSQNMKK